jgi:hypothetical protein
MLSSGTRGLELGSAYVEKCIQSFGMKIEKKETTWKTLARWEDNIKVYFKK